MNKGQWEKTTKAETEMAILVFQLELSSEVPMFLPMILLYRSPGMATMCKLASATLARLLCRNFADPCDKNIAVPIFGYFWPGKHYHLCPVHGLAPTGLFLKTHRQK